MTTFFMCIADIPARTGRPAIRWMADVVSMPLPIAIFGAAGLAVPPNDRLQPETVQSDGGFDSWALILNDA